MRARTASVGVLIALAGCGGATWLPTTRFHASLDPSVTEPTESDWARLARVAPSPAATSVADTSALSGDEWIAWTTDLEGHGAIMRVRRTSLGLEAQSFGEHAGPSIRPSVRALRIGDALVVVLESSSATDSIEREAWLYVEDGPQIVPVTLHGASARLRVRGERESALERGWSRATIFTATLEADGGAIVVHEHESVREVAIDRPELVARSSYEVERARTLMFRRGELAADRPSLFDEQD